MNTRQIALAAAFLAIVFIAHAAGRILQIGGAQLAPSIAIYVLMALLMAPGLGWGPLTGIALAVGILTMLATSSPFPLANIPGHGLAFLLSAYMAKKAAPEGQEIGVWPIILNLGVVLVISWTVFAFFTWLGLSATPFAAREWGRFGMSFGSGFIAWWLFGFIGVAVPTFIIAVILTPLLYRAVRPALVRQGMLKAA
ncbi:MAG: hypothetical protein D6784_16170 [Chloroflexi bacterium]|nr:MAG: hypothetical protein D6784_16170 [Chloroflexota bacterium]